MENEPPAVDLNRLCSFCAKPRKDHTLQARRGYLASCKGSLAGFVAAPDVAPAFDDEEEPTGPGRQTAADRLKSIAANLDEVQTDRLVRLCAAWCRLNTERQICLEQMALLLNTHNVAP